MKKEAQVQAVWPKIHRMLLMPPEAVKRELSGYSPPEFNKVVLEPGRLQENPQAIGHVSSEDAAEGVIHLNIGRLEEALRQRDVPLEKLSQIDNMSKDELLNVLSAFVSVLAHEGGHIEDFNPDDPENPFPMGEGAGEEAERRALQQLSVATNTSNKFDKSGRFNMDKQTLEILNKLAEDLDGLGAIKVADQIDAMMEKFAQASQARAISDELVRDLESGKYGPMFKSITHQIKDRTNPLSVHETLRGIARSVGDPEFTSRVSELGDAMEREQLAARMTKERVMESGEALLGGRQSPSSETPVGKVEMPSMPGSAVGGADYGAWFMKDTGLDSEYSLEVQTALWNLGYEVDTKTGKPDGLWGPVTSSSWKQFASDFRESMIADGVPEESVDMRMKMLTGGDIDRVRFMLKMAPKSQTFARLKEDRDVARATPAGEDPRKALYDRWMGMSEEDRAKFKEMHPRRFERLLDFVREREDLKEEVLRQSPLLRSHLDAPGRMAGVGASYEGEADDGQVTAKLTPEEKIEKIASDTKELESVFWPNAKTPFGR